MEIRLEVKGLPPAKGEAKSVLGPTHKHSSRVIALLEAAQRVIAHSGFEGFGKSRLRLAVDVYAAPEQEPWDATNYLGGIADSLEGKTRRLMNPQGLTFEHLGDLVNVGLYEDDRQIKQIIYREIAAEDGRARYVATLSSLAEPT